MPMYTDLSKMTGEELHHELSYLRNNLVEALEDGPTPSEYWIEGLRAEIREVEGEIARRKGVK